MCSYLCIDPIDMTVYSNFDLEPDNICILLCVDDVQTMSVDLLNNLCNSSSHQYKLKGEENKIKLIKRKRFH